jgi:predicted O-methyltransferase YrrM
MTALIEFLRSLPFVESGADYINAPNCYPSLNTLARELKAERVLEVGVFHGYGAIAIIRGNPVQRYTGVDAGFYDPAWEAHTRANLSRLDQAVGITLLKVDTQQMADGAFLGQRYNFIHVDGDHSYSGALHDLKLCWAELEVGGHMLVDDSVYSAEVAQACKDFAVLVDEPNYNVASLRGTWVFQKTKESKMRLPNHMIVNETPELARVLRSAVQGFGPLNVLETGTHRGTGTTRVLLHALEGWKLDSFFTLEADEYCYRQAILNLAGTGVQCLFGMSVKIEDAKKATLEDLWLRNPPEDCAQDCADPAGYLSEIHAAGNPVPEGLLYGILPLARPLICLDSAGSVGLLEFNTVLALQQPPFLLLLDDVNHVKHYRSRQYIEAHPAEWKIHGCNMQDGWMVAER